MNLSKIPGSQNNSIKIVNYIKSGNLSKRLFKQLRKDMNSKHEALLYYTSVRWLSRGNVLSRVFEMKDEIKSFLEAKTRFFHRILVMNCEWKSLLT